MLRLVHTVHGCGVNRRLDPELLVDDQASKNTPQQGHLKDGPEQVRWAETSRSYRSPSPHPSSQTLVEHRFLSSLLLWARGLQLDNVSHWPARGTIEVGPVRRATATAPGPAPPITSLQFTVSSQASSFSMLATAQHMFPGQEVMHISRHQPVGRGCQSPGSCPLLGPTPALLLPSSYQR